MPWSRVPGSSEWPSSEAFEVLSWWLQGLGLQPDLLVFGPCLETMPLFWASHELLPATEGRVVLLLCAQAPLGLHPCTAWVHARAQ